MPTLKPFISSSQTFTLPLLQSNGDLITDDTEKANLLNDYFRDQTLLDDATVVVLDIEYFFVTSHLDDITISSDEIRLTLKVVPISKAS